MLLQSVGRSRSVVGIATGYGLDGPGIESRWSEIFRTCSDRPWGPPCFLYNGYQVFPGGKERPGRDADPSPPSSAVGHERVELYLYSSYGPYGLCRPSVPVQGVNFTSLYCKFQSSLYRNVSRDLLRTVRWSLAICGAYFGNRCF